MSLNRVAELVLKAKGDRSYRQYQEDSGVDAAIISKIVTGKYIPKSPNIYKKLTSCESNGVAYEDLLDAADFSSAYKKGVKAGIVASEASLVALGTSSLAMAPGIGTMLTGLAGAVSNTLKKSNLDKIDDVDEVAEFINEVRRFSAIANGIIYSSFSQRGITFQDVTGLVERLFDNEIDTYLAITSGALYQQYILRYMYLDKTVEEDERLMENACKQLIEEMIFLKPDKIRKISIITESKKAFDYIKSFEHSISYKGNLSIILIDTKTVKFVEEVIISTYDDRTRLEHYKIYPKEKK